MATIFPASPALNDTFESDGTTWKWNGSAWEFFSGAGTVGGGGDATVAFQVDQPDSTLVATLQLQLFVVRAFVAAPVGPL